MMCRTRAKNPS